MMMQCSTWRWEAYRAVWKPYTNSLKPCSQSMQGEVKLPKPTWVVGADSGKHMERFLRDAVLYSNSNSSGSSSGGASESTSSGSSSGGASESTDTALSVSESAAATVSVAGVDAAPAALFGGADAAPAATVGGS